VNFSFPFDVLFDEALASVAVGVGSSSITRSDGRWWPRSLDLIESLRGLFGPEFDKQLRGEIRGSAPFMNRRERRTATSMIRRNGRFTSSGRQLVVGQSDEVANRLSSEFGLPPSPSRDKLIRILLKGDHPSRELALRFESEFFDVARFVPFYVDAFDKQKETIMWLRNLSMNLANVARQIQSDALALIARFGPSADVKLPSLIPPAKRGISHGLYRANKDAFRACHVRLPELEAAAVSSAADSMPSLDAVARLADQWVRANISDPAHPRKIRDSDGVDIFHCVYLAHVDVYKCDGFVKEQLKSAGVSGRAQIVSSPQELMEALESMTGNSLST
jgi:hypothetical protein